MKIQPINETQKKAFTLIELLAVIAIIGILAGLLIPGIQMGVRAAHKTRDTNAARQIVQAVVAEAMEKGGNFRKGPDDSTPAASAIEIFQGLLDEKRVDDPNIFMGEGSIAADSNTLKAENVGFSYITGLGPTSSSRMPLVFTKGVDLTTGNMKGKSFAAGDSAWKSDGFIVGYVGGNAGWVANTKSDNGGTIETARDLIFEDVPAGVEVLK